MAQEEKEYEVVSEAVEIIKNLCERYPEPLWAVNPEEIIVLGVVNKERPKKMTKLASIREFRGPIKAVLKEFSIGKKYLIELYFSDWQQWCPARRQWVLFHEVLHISGPHKKGLIKHDVEDFAVIMDTLGSSHWWEMDSLPDMLVGEKIEFDEKLYTRLHVDENDKEGEED